MAKSIATNTLLIPNLPPSFFVGDQALEHIRKECEKYGELHQFIPMKGFGRVMVIYLDTTCALAAKEDLDDANFYWIEYDKGNIKTARILGIDKGDYDIEELWKNVRETAHIPYQEKYIRLYFGQHNPINPDPAKFTLQVPDLGRNLLISPPGDPCHQWESREESPPNKAILASDLLRALTTVDNDNDVDMDGIDEFQLDEGPVSTANTNGDDSLIDSPSLLPSTIGNSTTTQSDTSTLQLSFDQENLPTIKIQDMDGSLLTQHQQKINRQKPNPTARPPYSNMILSGSLQ